MAMKFWFGKKEAEQSGRNNGSCDVLTIPDHAAEGGVGPSSLFVATPQRGVSGAEPRSLIVQPVFPAGAVSSGAQAAGAAGRAGAEEEKKKPAAPMPLRALSEAPKGVVAPRLEMGAAANPQASGSPFSLAAPGPAAAASAVAAAKTLLRPLGTPPVRMAAPAPAAPASMAPVSRVAAEPASVAPVARVAAAAEPVSGGAERLTFGLRPKAAAPAIAVQAPAEAPAAAPAANRAVADSAALRPKVDQRALYYELMNGLYDAVLILDDQGHVVDSNTRVAAVLGYTREETWDLPIDKVITGMTSQMFEHLRRNLAESHHILMDARCFRQDGTSFPGEVGVSTLSLTRGSNMVFAIRNVERRKNMMEDLRKGQEALQIALAPSFVCDTEGFFLIANQALLEAFGIPDETQAKSVRFVDLLPDAARFFLRASCGEKLRETLRVPTPDGLPVKVELALSPVQSGHTVIAVAGSILQV